MVDALEFIKKLKGVVPKHLILSILAPFRAYVVKFANPASPLGGSPMRRHIKVKMLFHRMKNAHEGVPQM